MTHFGWRQLLFLVPIIVVVMILTNRQIEPPPAPSATTSEERKSDYYLRQLQITHMGSDGTVDEEIFAELLTHFPQGDLSELSSPRFKIYRPNGEYLWAEADEGLIYGDERAVLRGDVHIKQHASNNQITSHIKSHEIEIEHATKKIISRKRVTINGENYTLVAGAMELLSNEKQLYLSNGVEGHYEP